MKIKMLTTKCGPVSSENWAEGQKRNVCVDEARYWEKLGVCEVLEPYPSETEKAVVIPVEKAVITAPEKAVVSPLGTAKVEVPPELTKAQAKAPATPPAGKSNVPASAKAATWGTPEVK